MANESPLIQRRRLGKSGLMVSNLGFGCMRLPIIDGNFEHIDEPTATKMVRKAIDALTTSTPPTHTMGRVFLWRGRANRL
jgi:Predicted oxidoreductases of the aldo/keto reductase family